MRILMGALIVLDVHNITVVEQLIKEGCNSVNGFDWSKQLRLVLLTFLLEISIMSSVTTCYSFVALLRVHLEFKSYLFLESS